MRAYVGACGTMNASPCTYRPFDSERPMTHTATIVYIHACALRLCPFVNALFSRCLLLLVLSVLSLSLSLPPFLLLSLPLFPSLSPNLSVTVSPSISRSFTPLFPRIFVSIRCIYSVAYTYTDSRGLQFLSKYRPIAIRFAYRHCCRYAR